MRYTITLKNQIRVLKFLIIGSLLFFAAGLFFYEQNSMYININTVQFVIIYYLFLLIPTLFLHIEYFIINKNDSISIDKLNETLIINTNKKISFNNIEKIILVMSPVLYRKGKIRFLPTDNYQFAIIKINGGDDVIFTSLMAFKVDEVMQSITGVPIERYRRLIPSTLLLPANLMENRH